MSMSARRSGVPVVLTAHEFKLLKFFTDNPDRVLTRELLLNEVWGYNFYPTTRTVDNQILKLRQKVGAGFSESKTSAYDLRRGVQICAVIRP